MIIYNRCDRSQYVNGDYLYGNGDCNSPYVNGESPFPYGDAHWKIPVWKRRSPYGNGYPFSYGDFSVTNPFKKRDCNHLGINQKIPKWKHYQTGNPRFHTGIPICIRAGIAKNSHLGNPYFRKEFVTT